VTGSDQAVDASEAQSAFRSFAFRRGATYRVQVLVLEHEYGEAHKLLEELAGSAYGFTGSASSGLELQLEYRFEFMRARALLSTGHGKRGRERLLALRARTEQLDPSKADAIFTFRLLSDIANVLSEAGCHKQAIEITGRLAEQAEAEKSWEPLGRQLTNLASRHITAGFEHESQALVLPSTSELERTQRSDRAANEYHRGGEIAELALKLRRSLAETDRSAEQGVVLARSALARARFRHVLITRPETEALIACERDAMETAQAMSAIPGHLPQHMFQEFARVGVVRAARAALLTRDDPSSRRAIAQGAIDVLAPYVRWLQGTGEHHTPEITHAYATALELRGDHEDAHRVFTEGARYLEDVCGPSYGAARLFRLRAAQIEPAHDHERDG
jgi:hypothetical protein